MKVSLGDIVLIKGDGKHRRQWNVGMVDKLYRGKDGVIRAVGLRTSKSYIELRFNTCTHSNYIVMLKNNHHQ